MSREPFAELPQQLEQLQPPEKSWYANLGFLALLEDSPLVVESLRSYGLLLPTDTTDMCRSTEQIARGERIISVGEGGAWARRLAYGNAKFGWGLSLEKARTLQDRPDEFTPDMVDASIAELRTLNKGSSQLASAAVLCGSDEPMPPDAPYHLRMAYEARDFWQQWPKDQLLPLRRDATLRRHTLSWLNWHRTGSFMLDLVQPEDYPIARVFEAATPEQALELGWGSLEGHESSRFFSVDDSIDRVARGLPVPYADHRILQALRFKHGWSVRFDQVQAISKSWPLPNFNATVALGRELAAAA
jgi:hypothetical protein